MCIVFLDIMLLTLNRLQYSGITTFICTGKPKICDSLYWAICFIALEWNPQNPRGLSVYVCRHGFKYVHVLEGILTMAG